MADYANPMTLTYVLDSATVSAAADLLEIVGPNGMKGAVRSVSAVITTATTVAASNILVGKSADKDAYATLNLPIATAGNGYNAATLLNTDSNLIAADSVVYIGSDGGSTAGAATIVVVIDWFV